MNIEPLRVEILFDSPITEPTYPIHLDALVAWAAVEEAYENDAEEPLLAQEALPFDRAQGVWCASALSFDACAPPFTVATTKKTDLSAIAEASNGGVLRSAPNKLSINAGPWRQALVYSQCQIVSKAEAWCVGDAQRLRELLGRVSYVGAKRRNGRGRVFFIDVVKDSSASSRWRERILPEAAEGYLPIQAVTSPPYWDRARVTDAWVHPNVV